VWQRVLEAAPLFWGVDEPCATVGADPAGAVAVADADVMVVAAMVAGLVVSPPTGFAVPARLDGAALPDPLVLPQPASTVSSTAPPAIARPSRRAAAVR
jgi:hypothetical protein